VLLERRPYYVTKLCQLPYQAIRLIARRKCRGYALVEPFLRNKDGLEIGGPSPIFRRGKLIPVYDRCRAIDQCNFSRETIWGDASGRRRFGPCGKQYVAEASDLSVIRDGIYDFVLASHVLEHVANPLGALQEWKRVLTPGGALLVVVPDKRVTFDHKRPFTAFDHLQVDFQANTPESDLTHLNEILALHALDLDPFAGSRQQFRERCLRNASVRAMHHHVFSPKALILMFNLLQMRVLNMSIERPYHIIAIVQKADQTDEEQVRLDNLNLLGEDADWRKQDPFRGYASTPVSENLELR
jgi:SAM-dependent methyltransferase